MYRCWWISLVTRIGKGGRRHRVAGAARRTVPRSPPGQSPAPNVLKICNMTWEYMVREFSVEEAAHVLLLEEFLTEAGKDGWELVGVASTPTTKFNHLVYLKRGLAMAKPV